MTRLPLYIQHVLNPLHVYCRLRDLNIRKTSALEIATVYDKMFFQVLKTVTTINNFNGELKDVKCNNNKKGNGELDC